jgi:hypothetical protein
MGAPNAVWSADCTGHFKTGDGRYGYPLTIADGYSRFLLRCQALSSTSVAEATPVFTRVCKACGLPQRIRTDAACDEPSPRPMPTTRPPLESPDRFEVRYVSANGGIRWNHQGVNVSTTCAGEYVGLEESDDGVWNVDCGPLTLGRLRERYLRIEDASARLTRHR